MAERLTLFASEVHPQRKSGSGSLPPHFQQPRPSSVPSAFALVGLVFPSGSGTCHKH